MDTNDDGTRNQGARRAHTSDKSKVGPALVVFVLVLAAVIAAGWWFLKPSGTTAEISVSSSQPVVDDGVEILQMPSLTATATIDGLPADGPIDVTFGTASELVVNVLNDGNLTMSDITVSMDISEDGSVTTGVDSCTLPTLAPNESADCTMEFTPTSSTTSVVANILGFGPQRQEVARSVNIVLQ